MTLLPGLEAYDEAVAERVCRHRKDDGDDRNACLNTSRFFSANVLNQLHTPGRSPHGLPQCTQVAYFPSYHYTRDLGGGS